MTLRDETVQEQLGMPWGTANNKLRKSILFMLVKESDRDICVRCGSRITSENELSIEHINPWYNRNPELFWSLDNIGFSHVYCNKRHETTTQRFIQEDMTWCSRCKKFKTSDSFGINNSRWNGKQYNCKTCVSFYNSKRNRSK